VPAIAWIGLQGLLQPATYPGRIEFQKADPEFDMKLSFESCAIVRAGSRLGHAGGPLSPNPICASGQPGVSGLKSGDEITAIDGLPFRRVEDGLTIFEVLFRFKPRTRTKAVYFAVEFNAWNPAAGRIA
jgi:hypothetical protein